MKERKAALKEGDATAETQAARIAQLEEDLDFTEALRADLVSQRNELHANVEASAKTTKGSPRSLPPPPPSLGLPKA